MADNLIKLSDHRVGKETTDEELASQCRWLELGVWVRKLNKSVHDRDVAALAKSIDELLYVSDELVLYAEDF